MLLNFWIRLLSDIGDVEVASAVDCKLLPVR